MGLGLGFGVRVRVRVGGLTIPRPPAEGAAATPPAVLVTAGALRVALAMGLVAACVPARNPWHVRVRVWRLARLALARLVRVRARVRVGAGVRVRERVRVRVRVRVRG